MTGRAQSRVIYLNRDGASLRPGDNDSVHNISTVIDKPTEMRGWNIDDDTWQQTVDCMKDIYAPFDVTVTDSDPGNAPHIEALFGGSPGDVGLPDNVAGVSPFTTDCSIIEHSIVFAFTDVMNDDPRTVCEVMAQEVAHSFGLDHEMLASDPMTYLAYLGDRTFKDQMATCGEFGSRMCGIDGSVCRTKQNSVELLNARLGPNPNGAGSGAGAETGSNGDDVPASGIISGCDVGGGAGNGIALVLLTVRLGLRKRSRHRRHRSLLQRGGGDREGGP